MDNSTVVAPVTEQMFRGWLSVGLKNYWHSYTEPSIGSTMGQPDMTLLLPGSNFPMPVELKLATFMAATYRGNKIFRVRPTKLRPAQIFWHEGLARAGGLSCLLLGVPMIERGFKVYVLGNCRLEMLRCWRDGYHQDDLVKVADAVQNAANPYYIDMAAWKQCLLANSRVVRREVA